jgi:ATP-dependent DNA ligase
MALPLKPQLEGGDDALIRFVQHFEKSGEAVLRSACRLSIKDRLKKLDAPYRSGRSRTWMKAKCRAGMRSSSAGGPEWIQVLARGVTW